MMDEIMRDEVKRLLERNEKLLESIQSEDEEKLDEVLYAKLQKAMSIQLLVRYALRLEERAEDELLQELREIAGVE